MRPEAAHPVFIFLPMHADSDGDVVVDPVCGRALSDEVAVGRLLYNGSYHYFCSLRCAERFAAGPGGFGPE